MLYLNSELVELKEQCKYSTYSSCTTLPPDKAARMTVGFSSQVHPTPPKVFNCNSNKDTVRGGSTYYCICAALNAMMNVNPEIGIIDLRACAFAEKRRDAQTGIFEPPK